MSREDALELWKSLDALTLDEMNGEYTGSFHDGGDPAVRTAKNDFFHRSPCGVWLGKAYKPGRTMGEGYNFFRENGKTVRRYRRFATGIGASSLDDRPSLIMSYRAYDNYAGAMDLVDEVRRLDHDTYLCVYTGTETVPGFSTLLPGKTRSEPELFALRGPVGPWIGVDDPHRELH